MQKKTIAFSLILLSIIFITSSCKKSSSSPVINPNGPHPLSEVYYVRALIDTSWVYQSNNNREECQSNGLVCGTFLTFGPNSSLNAVKFTLVDSAHPAPKDSVIRSWVGKTFAARTDTASSHAYTFSFEYPDAQGREMSSDYVVNNTGARLTIDSVVYDGLSQYYFDSITPYKSFRIKGTLNCKITHFGDSVTHNVSQGVYSINVIEAK
jgi:hypothetical protein